MSYLKRSAVMAVTILLVGLGSGILLAYEPASQQEVVKPVNEAVFSSSNSPDVLDTWPIMRHDSGHTAYNPDTGSFRPPLALLDTFNVDDPEPDAQQILNLVTSPTRIFAAGNSIIWGIKNEDLSDQWRYDDCFPEPGQSDLCFINNMAYAGDRIVIIRQRFFFSTFDFGFDLTVLNAATGNMIWSRDLGESAPEFAMDGSDILLLIEEASGGKLLKLSLSGTQRFIRSADITGAPNGPAVSGGGQFIYGRGDRILAYDTETGLNTWIYTDTLRIDPRQYDLVATDDSVIVSQDERVIRLNMSDGTEVWQEDIKPAICGGTTSPNASATDGTTIAVMAVCDDEVVALNYADGAEKWRKSIGLQTASAVAITSDTLYAASVTSPEFNIYALNPDTGEELEKIVLGAGESSSVLAISDGLLLTASNIGTETIHRFERMPADLSAVMSPSSLLACGASVGGTATFSFLVTNHGPGPTDDTRADLTLPDGGAIIDTDTGNCTAGDAPFCSLGPLSNGQQAHITATVVLSKAGSYSPGISLSGGVRDPDERNDSDSQPLTVYAATPGEIDLLLTDIEITQGVQNLANEVPLVNGKPTFVRLYGRTNGGSVRNATAVLHGEALGTGVDLGTISPIQSTVCQDLDEELPDRDQLAESFVFELPKEWWKGTISITAEINPGGAIPDTDPTNNTLSITRGFTTLPRVCLKTYPVRTTGVRPGSDDETDNLFPDPWSIADDTGNILSRAFTMLPVRQIKVYPSSHLIEEWEPFSSDGWGPYEMMKSEDNRGDVLDTLWWLNLFSDDPDLCDIDDSRTHYIGMVHTATTNDVGSAGLGIRDGDEAMLFLNTGPNGPQAFDDPHAGLTLAHEIGHNYDRGHVNCGSPKNIDTNYPDDRSPCNFAPIDVRGYYGLEFRDPTSPTVITPTMAGDVMSYADDVWPSEYTWEAIQRKLCDANDCTFPALETTKTEFLDPPPPITGDVLLVRGEVSPTIVLQDAYRLPVELVPKADEVWAQQIASRPLTPTYALNLISDTVILHSEPFTPTHMDDQNSTHLTFGLVVPWNPLTTRIEVTATGSVVYSLTVSASPPTVTAIIPNGGEVVTDVMEVSWEASDPDGDILRYTVLYSGDDGNQWQTLVTGFETTTVTVDSSLLPGSVGQGRVKVIASDGLNSASRHSASGFTIPNRAPRTAIHFPDDGGEYDTGSSLTLRGIGFDPEDDYLEGDSMLWHVTGLGDVGTGETATISDLETGVYSVTLSATDSQSVTVSTTIAIVVRPGGPPVAPQFVEITATTAGTISMPIPFEAEVSPIDAWIPITYVWQAANHDAITRTSGITDSISFTWDSPGLKTITLSASNTAGSITGTHVITIHEPAQANFSGTPEQGPAPLMVSFTNASTGIYDTCSWVFGDGGTSSECDPSYMYSFSGTYTVSLTVDGQGGSSTETKADYITVFEPSSAEFSAAPTNGVTPLLVSFTDQSSGDYETCSWEFGDGGASSDCNPDHSYTNGGLYTVTLIVDGPGGLDTETKVNYISVYEPVAADFSAAPTAGIAPLSVNFTNLSTGDYDSCSWSFGDGGASSECDPNHSYDSGGIYTVTLNMDGLGGSDSETKVSYITVYEPVAADFSAAPTSGVAPLLVDFTNLSTGDFDSCQWEFGDGSTSDECDDPSHRYDLEGSYTITLTVTGLGGAHSETKTDYVSVELMYYTFIPAAVKP